MLQIFKEAKEKVVCYKKEGGEKQKPLEIYRHSSISVITSVTHDSSSV